jgi:hypothetical protein
VLVTGRCRAGIYLFMTACRNAQQKAAPEFNYL